MKSTIAVAVSLLLGGAAAALPASAATTIQNKGSDTLVNVAQAWAEAYSAVNPDVAVAVSGGGSGTGIAALINGTVDIANASRKMKDKEVTLATENGHNPVEHVVGYDALAVFLNKNNPAKSLNFEQLAQIFGRGGKATKWTDIGLEVPGCKDQEIVVVSRQNSSGTYAYFKEAVLEPAAEEGHIAKGVYRQGTRDMSGSKDVVDLVENTPCAIGYSGLAYATDKVKMACISKASGGESECVNPSVEGAVDGSYPIARPLFMYTSGEPEGAVKEYLDWIKSDAGQCIILKKGYAPYRPVTCN